MKNYCKGGAFGATQKAVNENVREVCFREEQAPPLRFNKIFAIVGDDAHIVPRNSVSGLRGRRPYRKNGE